MSDTPEQPSAEPVIFEESERVSLVDDGEWCETFKGYAWLLTIRRQVVVNAKDILEEPLVVGATNGDPEELVKAYRERYQDWGDVCMAEGPAEFLHALEGLTKYHKNDVLLS